MTVIHLVEDDADTRDLLRLRLMGQGHVVDATPSGEEALARLAWAPRPDLLILDVGLPGRDGFDTALMLRGALGADVPIVFLTAYVDELCRRRGDDLGAVAYLVKPCALDRLLACVEAADPAPGPRRAG